MDDLGMKDVELGFGARIAQSAISRFFNADHIPTLTTIVRIAEALGLSVEVRFVPNAPAQENN